jgi:hypothetical protein
VCKTKVVEECLEGVKTLVQHKRQALQWRKCLPNCIQESPLTAYLSQWKQQKNMKGKLMVA